MKTKIHNKFHTQQLDQSSCGIACLQMLLKFYDAKVFSNERLRELSGTFATGTSLLGLLEASNKIGFESEGFEADIESLKKCERPTILHVVIDGRLQHFIVCYGYDENNKGFLISNPAKQQGEIISPDELGNIWKSKALLVLTPTDHLQKASSEKKNKKYWLKNLVEQDLNILGLAFVIGVVVAVLGLSVAIFSQKLIDVILLEKDISLLIRGTFLLLFLLFAKAGFGYLRGWFLIKQSKDFNVRLIDYFYSCLIELPKPFFDNRKTGDFIARMNDTRRIQRVVSRLVSNVMIDTLLVIASIVGIFIYTWQAGLVIIAWMPLFVFVVVKYHSKILKNQKEVMVANARNESNYIDTIQGVGVIKATNTQPFFLKITNAIFFHFQKTIFDLGKISIGFSFIIEIINTILVIVIIVVSSVYVINDMLTLGGMIAILQMVSILMSSSIQIALANIEIQEATVAFDRMYEFTSISSEYGEEDKTRSVLMEFADLQVKNLSFRFPGRKKLLNNISFHVSKGEWISVLGESGCGKSTILQILQKFYSFESGKIKINGVDLDLISYENWRLKLGVVSQEIKIFSGNLIDNIVLHREEVSPEKIESFFVEYGFDRFFKHFPNGYGTILGEGGVNLSGGQKQLVGLARALYHHPHLLLLDEPTAALDRNTELFVLELLDKLRAKGTAIITFTHKLKTAQKADRIYLIENGRIEKQGNHFDLMKSENLYSNAWNDLVGV